MKETIGSAGRHLWSFMNTSNVEGTFNSMAFMCSATLSLTTHI